MGNDPGLCCWIDASVGLRFQGIGKLDNAPATIVEKGLISSYFAVSNKARNPSLTVLI